MADTLFPFDFPLGLAIGGALAVATIALAAFRRVAMTRGAKVLGAVGLVLLALSAGGPTWRRPAAGEVAVLVDLSPSTRGAAFRDRAALDERVKALLGDTPYRVYLFAGGAPVADAGGEWNEHPADRTVFSPPATAAVLLFSDGRFALPPAAPRVFAVIDPGLETAVDARVTSLRVDGSDAVAQVAATVSRALQWSGTRGSDSADPVPPGTHFLSRAVPEPAGGVSARLSPGDRWPENDALTIHPPPPIQLERWLVTTSAQAPTGYRVLAPGAMPTDGAAYLSASVIVLDNVPANALPPAVLQLLQQYARDLGGGLVILGGDQAFAAGGYVSTPLDAVSPLASAPPRPATHWILVTDGSGSMNADADGRLGGQTRWQAATAALLRLLPSLPAEDPVDVGSFAEAVTWWSAGRSAKDTRNIALPPAGISPRGPTNLRPAIEEAISRHEPALPGNLLLLSDADAEVGDVISLVELLKSRNVKLHLLAIDAGPALEDLREVVRQTGGQMVRQDDAARWATAAAELLNAAAEKHLVAAPATVTFGGPLRALPEHRVEQWNRTWLKPKATELAANTRGSQSLAMAASWQVGEGRVAAAAFRPTLAEGEALAGLVARPPRDPRINVTWETGPVLRVRVDAVDVRVDATEPYLNGRPLVLELSPAGTLSGTAAVRHSLQQTAPGRYELELPAPLRPEIATLRNAERVIERFAVAGRYAPEFDAVGIDRENLNQLASRTGGRVIEPSEAKPIDFRWPRREVSLTAWLAAAGAVFVLASMLWWRWG